VAPQWDEEFRFEVTEDAVLQNEPIEFKVREGGKEGWNDEDEGKEAKIVSLCSFLIFPYFHFPFSVNITSISVGEAPPSHLTHSSSLPPSLPPSLPTSIQIVQHDSWQAPGGEDTFVGKVFIDLNPLLMRTGEEDGGGGGGGGGREGGREGGRGRELLLQGLYPLYDTLKGARGDLGKWSGKGKRQARREEKVDTNTGSTI